MFLTVIYPAFNEEQGLRRVIERSIGALDRLGRDYEILIVEDCSRDSTPRLADECAAAHAVVRVLHNERNLGQGESVLRGFREARGDWVLHNGVDYPFDLDDLPKLLAETSSADVVVAMRHHWDGYSPYRVLVSQANRALLKLLFPLKLKDYNFVQLFKRDVLEKVKPAGQSTGFLIPGLLISAYDRGFRIKGVDIRYHARETGQASSGRLSVVGRSLRDLLVFWWRRRRGGHEKVPTDLGPTKL